MRCGCVTQKCAVVIERICVLHTGCCGPCRRDGRFAAELNLTIRKLVPTSYLEGTNGLCHRGPSRQTEKGLCGTKPKETMWECGQMSGCGQQLCMSRAGILFPFCKIPDRQQPEPTPRTNQELTTAPLFFLRAAVISCVASFFLFFSFFLCSNRE